MKKRVIDKRDKGFFMLDDEYLNGYAKLCGWKASLVYFSLCRHVDKEQRCFPSIKRMAKQHAISVASVKRGLEILKDWNIIGIEKKKKADGTWKNNVYTLFDKSEWKSKPNQGSNSALDGQGSNGIKPGLSQIPDQGSVVANKDTHNEGNTYKETHTAKTSFYAAEVNKILQMFSETVNPTIGFNNKTQRKATEELIVQFGFEKTAMIVTSACAIQGQKYAPVITNPLELKKKLAHLRIYFEKKQNTNIAYI